MAARAKALIAAAGFPVGEERERGWDHGVFIPMKVAVPAADIPLVQLSLRKDLDPAVKAKLYGFLISYGRIGSADPVVADLDVQDPIPGLDPHLRRRGLRVLHHVGEAL